VARWETDAYSAYLQYFFPPEVMRRYRPDYLPLTEYQRQLAASPVRQALLSAARLSRLQPSSFPRREFIVENEAQFIAELTEAQKDAAKLEPLFERLHQIIRQGEPHREHEQSPRWQAGYDLAMGRILANKVRTEGYNSMLARAKRGLRPEDPRDNGWTLVSSSEVSGEERLQQLAESARSYLGRVVQKHKETPWALLAQKELEIPLGYKWESFFREPEPKVDQQAIDPTPRAPIDDQRQMLERPRPSRPVPRL
jgi:hypothetical protein